MVACSFDTSWGVGSGGVVAVEVVDEFTGHKTEIIESEKLNREAGWLELDCFLLWHCSGGGS